MEDSGSYNSDEEIKFTSKKCIKKSALVMSDDEELDKELLYCESRSEINENSKVVDEANMITFDEDGSKARQFNRLKRLQSSDSDSESDSSEVPKEDEFEDKCTLPAEKKMIVDYTDIASDSLKKDKFQDDIYDAEASSDEEIKENSPIILNENNDTSPPASKKKLKSAKSKGDKKKKEVTNEVDEIHKEAQRMMRESRVSLPYHIPRQRSLQDFLSRRKAVPIVPLKSTSENLSLVWKHLEEREKTAESFYNSETEESDQDEKKMKSCDEEKSKPVEHSSQSIEAGDTAWKVNETSCNSTSKDVHMENNESTNDSVANLNIDENALSTSLFDKKHFSNTSQTTVNNMNKTCNDTDKSEEVCKSSDQVSKVSKISDSDLINIDLRISDSSCSMINDEKIASCSDKSKQQNEILKDDENNSAAGNKPPVDEEFTAENLKQSLFDTLDKEDDILPSSTDSPCENNDKDSSCTKLSESNVNSTTINPDSNCLLEKVPKLSCGPGDEIDLDQPVIGASKLLKRFIKHSKLKTTIAKEEKTVKLSVTSVETTAGGEITSMTEEELAISSKEPKPGQRLCALKQSLRKLIEVTRSQLLAKRIQQYKIYEQEFYEETGGDPKEMIEDEDEEFEKEMFGDKIDENSDDEVKNKSSDDENSIVENEEDDEEDNDDNIDNEEDVEESGISKKKDFLDEEADVTDDEDSSESESESGGESDSEMTSRNNEDKPSLDSSMSHSKKLDLSSLGLNEDFEENSDLIGLCSGKFQTQPVRLTQLEGDSSQSYDSSVKVNENDFSQEMFSQKSVKAANILDSDDDDDNDVEETQNNVSKIIKRLQFSDDEDDDKISNNGDNKGDEMDSDIDNETDADEDGKVNEENETDIDDDKENVETHIDAINDDDNVDEEVGYDEGAAPKVIQYDSEEEIVEGGKFLDVEAELSGSEWGSEDEDERGLSDFEADEADLEKISQSKLKKELGRIHMQELMAEDKREIRLLQELLLEDGDLHSDGPKRQRLFRWSNQDGVNMEKVTLSDEEAGGREEEEEEKEHEWRKQRQEREKFLSSNRKEEEADNVMDESINLPVNEKKLLKHQQQSTPKLSSNLSSPDPKLPFKLLTNRGSFLGRGEKVLNKLACLAAPTDQQQQRVRRNMVFSAVSPPKNETQDNLPIEVEKRKAEESLANISKKLRLNRKSINGMRSLGLLQKLRDIDQAT